MRIFPFISLDGSVESIKYYKSLGNIRNSISIGNWHINFIWEVRRATAGFFHSYFPFFSYFLSIFVILQHNIKLCRWFARIVSHFSPRVFSFSLQTKTNSLNVLWKVATVLSLSIIPHTLVRKQKELKIWWVSRFPPCSAPFIYPFYRN